MSSAPEVCYRHPDRETRVHCTRCERPICPECMTAAPVGHHCPTCVAEARKETRRIRRPFSRPKSVTIVLLLVNVGVFAVDAVIALFGNRDVLLEAGAMIPVLIAQGEWWRLITAIFLHIGILHLAFNSLALFVFGGLIESALGSTRMLILYLVTGFAASVASFTFGASGVAAAGASGAIFGLLGAWLVYNLRRRSLSLARSNVQSALFLIGINLVFGFTVPGIDNIAHIGGLVSGVLAGFAAEGFGRGPTRRLTRVGGFLAITVVALVLAVWRISQLS
ncbi:MAG: rhomboid family intramembrane serine protease [Actinomycetota bacterium]